MVACYGFPSNGPETKRQNDILLAQIYKYVTSIGIPYMIGGDFNMPPQSLPIWSAFKGIGAVEAFELFRHRNLVDLPPTCRGSTRHDTCIIHPFLAKHISDMDVVQICHQ